MKFKLNVQKLIENPAFKEQIEIWKKEQQDRYGGRGNEVMKPEEFLIVTSLEVELSEEQFNSMRKAVLEVF